MAAIFPPNVLQLHKLHPFLILYVLRHNFELKEWSMSHICTCFMLKIARCLLPLYNVMFWSTEKCCLKWIVQQKTVIDASWWNIIGNAFKCSVCQASIIARKKEAKAEELQESREEMSAVTRELNAKSQAVGQGGVEIIRSDTVQHSYTQENYTTPNI